jgi:peptide chain release factor 2
MMRERNKLETSLSSYEALAKDFGDAVEMIELATEEGDRSLITDAEQALRDITLRAKDAELQSLFSGEADGNDCYVEIHAGAGGTESQDWASMLFRMYTRWAERKGFKWELMEGRKCLWLVQDRVGRASPGTDFALRLQCPSAHELCQRLGLPGRRRLDRN